MKRLILVLAFCIILTGAAALAQSDILIDLNGNMETGVTNPDGRLEVNGDTDRGAVVGVTGGTGKAIHGVNSDPSGYAGYFDGNAKVNANLTVDGEINLNSGTGNGLIVESGNVGIGKVNPLYLLDISADLDGGPIVNIAGTCSDMHFCYSLQATNDSGKAIVASSVDSVAIDASSTYEWGISGYSTNSTGVRGIGGGAGVVGSSDYGMGVSGYSGTGTGGYFGSLSGYGLIVESGNVGIGTTTPSIKLQVEGGADADLSDGSGYLVIGSESGSNIVMDNNEIMARNNGVTSPIFIQNKGGNTILNSVGGNVGIGTNSPTHALHIDGNDSALRIEGTGSLGSLGKINFGDGNYAYIHEYQDDDLRIHASNVAIGDGAHSARKFFVNGDAGGISAWFNDSDQRLKKDIKTIDSALDKVQKLRGVYFKWNDTNERPDSRQVGVIAQEVKEVLPEIVEQKGEHYSVATSSLVAVLIEAVKEQQNTISELSEKVKDLERDAKLKDRLASVESFYRGPFK